MKKKNRNKKLIPITDDKKNVFIFIYFFKINHCGLRRL